MFKLLAVLALISASVAHRFAGKEWKQTYKPRTPYVYKSVTWEEAHEYEECPEFEHDNYEEPEKGEIVDGVEAENGMHHFLSRHNPKLIEDCCARRNYTQVVNGVEQVVSREMCPDLVREDSGFCGFETITIPAAKWIVIDVEKDDVETFQVRETYKKMYYEYRKPKGVRWMLPVLVKWQLNEDRERVSGQIAMYVPPENQSNPPKPDSDLIRIEEWGARKVYVRPYGGYRHDKEFRRQWELLRTALDNAELSYKDNEEWEAGYSYLRYGRQRNEAMFVASASEA